MSNSATEHLAVASAYNRVRNGDFTQGEAYWTIASTSHTISDSALIPDNADGSNNGPKRELDGTDIVATQRLAGTFAKSPSYALYRITSITYNAETITIVATTRETTGNVTGGLTMIPGSIVTLGNMPLAADDGLWRVVTIISATSIELRPLDDHAIVAGGPPTTDAFVARNIDLFRYQIGVALTIKDPTQANVDVLVTLRAEDNPTVDFLALTPQSKPFSISPVTVQYLDIETGAPPAGGQTYVRAFYAFDQESADYYDFAEIEISSTGAGIISDVFVIDGETVSIQELPIGSSTYQTTDLVEYSVDPVQIMAPGGEIVMVVGEACPPGYSELVPQRTLGYSDGSGVAEYMLSDFTITTQPSNPSRAQFRIAAATFDLAQQQIQTIMYAGMQLEIDAAGGPIHLRIVDVIFKSPNVDIITDIRNDQLAAMLALQTATPATLVHISLADFQFYDLVKSAEIDVVSLDGIISGGLPVAPLITPPTDLTIRIYDAYDNQLNLTITSAANSDTNIDSGAISTNEDLAAAISSRITTAVEDGVLFDIQAAVNGSAVSIASVAPESILTGITIVSNIPTPNFLIVSTGHSSRVFILGEGPAVRDVDDLAGANDRLQIDEIEIVVGDIIDFIEVLDISVDPPIPATVSPRRVLVSNVTDDFIEFTELDGSALPAGWADSVGDPATRTNTWRLFPAQQFGHSHLAREFLEGVIRNEADDGGNPIIRESHTHKFPPATDLPSYLRVRLCERL